MAAPAVVLVTDGAEGVRLVHRDGVDLVPVPQVEVVDTVGAGDAFGAGFLHCWLASGRRRDLSDTGALVRATAYGTRVAALICTRSGADPPSADEMVRAYGGGE